MCLDGSLHFLTTTDFFWFVLPPFFLITLRSQEQKNQVSHSLKQLEEL